MISLYDNIVQKYTMKNTGTYEYQICDTNTSIIDLGEEMVSNNTVIFISLMPLYPLNPS